MKLKKVGLIAVFYSVAIIVCVMTIAIIANKNRIDENELVTGEIENEDKLVAETNENETTDCQELYNIYTFVSDYIKSNAEEVKVSAELNEEVTLSSLVKSTENIAIVRIISLDSSSAEFDQVVGKTYGKLIVNTVIKGNLQEGDVVEYAALGGYLTIAEWEQYQPSTANEKRDYLRKQNGTEVDKNTTYMHLQIGNNLDVEEGKTYLAYLNYNEDMEKYEIVGFEDGLMEINVNKEESTVSTIDIDGQELKIKNNDSGEYESLDEYINEIKENI